MPGENLTRIEAASRAEILSVESYEVTLDLTGSEKTFSSNTRVIFDCSKPGASTFIDAITDKVHAITLNGVSLDPATHSDGLRIERGPKRGTTPAFCAISCGAFDPAGTLKPAAVRLPPAMDWGCVNWRGHAGNVPDLRPAQVSPESQSVDAVSTRAGEGGACAQ